MGANPNMGLFGNYMLNEEIKQPLELQEVDITHAIDKGLSAYWQEVTKSFPNMKTKDLLPEVAQKFRDAAMEAVKAWLQSKRPGEVGVKIDFQPAVPSFNSFNQNSSAKQTQQWNQFT